MAFDFDKLEKLDTGIPGQNVKTPGFDFGALPSVSAPAPVEEKKPGFVKSVVQDIAKPFLKVAVSPFAAVKGAVELAKGDTAKANETLTKDYDFGYFGKTKALGAEVDPTAPALKQLGQLSKEAVGTALELGSNFVGGGGAAGIGKSLLKSQLKRAVIGGVKTGATMGALGAGGRALQADESLGNVALETAIGGGVGALAGAGLGVAGVGAKAIMTPLSTVTQKIAPALESISKKIETTVLRPTKSDFQGGFKAENVLKHDLGGTVKDTIEKATEKLKVLRNQAKALRAGSTEAISLNQIVQDTANEVLNNRVGSFGVNRKMEKAMADFVKEMEYISPNGKITVPQAQEIKEALGTFGSWLFGSRDLDATAQERVANIMYSKVKTAIEKNSPKELGDVNRQMSEIIPIKNAAIRRLPVEERNNAIGLGDIISAGVALQNPTGWGLLIANQLQKSGRFAQNLYRGAGALRTGAEKIQSKIPGLRISPESLIQRNQKLKTNVLEKGAQSLIPAAKAAEKTGIEVGQAAPVITKGLRSKTAAEEIAFKRAAKLSPEDRLVEDRAVKKFIKNKEKMVQEYIAKNGKVANTDEARKLFASSGYKGYNSAAVQEPSSELNKAVFRTMLKNNPEPYVTIYAGGSGSGKTTAVAGQKRVKNIMDKSAAILDGNLSSYKSAIDRVTEAVNAGKIPKFVYVYRDPVDAFENGVVARMSRNAGEGGRIVPVSVTAGNHKDALAVIKKLYQEAPAKNKKDFKFIDNSLGLGKSKLITYEELQKKSMPSDLEKILTNKVKELYDQGKLTKLQYKKYLE